MKKLLLFFACTAAINLTAQNLQIITPEDYDLLKKNGQLNQSTRYVFPNSNDQIDNHLSSKDLFSSSEKSICSCLIPLDTTFSIVPFNSGIAPDYRNDDGSSNSIAIPFSFNFYGVNYDSLYINNNGNISFNSQYSTFTANSFPDSSNNMIAPFWADVDTRDSIGSGLVYYKITPTAMIVKWENVGYFDIHSDKLNTFQLTISNGIDPIIPNGNNVSFCYGDMQWTTGDASFGTNGFGGIASTVGVNQGNGADYFQIGTFDTLSVDFDGPYNTNDGVDFLDNQEIYFNLAAVGNVPPLIMSSYICDTIDVYTGDTLKSMHVDSIMFVIGVMTPEIDQIVQATFSCDQADHFSYFMSKDTPTFKEYTCVFYAENLMDNDTEQLYHITANATDNGIPAGSTNQTFVIRTNYDKNLSLSEYSKLESSFSMYPNPSDGTINVKHNFKSTANPFLSIADVSGKNVFSAALSQNNQNIDISSLITGVYFATITTQDGEMKTIKIICK